MRGRSKACEGTLRREGEKKKRTEEFYRRTESPGWSPTLTLFPPVLCRTLGLCCTFSWVRGDTGECWWL